jgi:flagellar hook-associated protein 1 FlgK
MSSTFGSLNTALSGLNAARQGSAVTGQNIANSATEGYTRQRVSTSALGPVARVGLFSTGVTPGQGVGVDGIRRLGDTFLDARVRSTSAEAGFFGARTKALDGLEGILQEPGKNGTSAALQKFWTAWQDVANNAGAPAPSGVLLEEAAALSAKLAHGHTQIEAQFSGDRRQLDLLGSEVNATAAQIAELNAVIRSTLNAGGSANELIDKRSQLTATVASLVGGTARPLGDGTIEVLVGGNVLVSGNSVSPLQVSGGYRLEDAAAGPVRLEWAHRPGVPVPLDGGRIAGIISTLGPVNGAAAGGEIAEAAAAYNAFAVKLAESVNAVHRGGGTPDGRTGLDFFRFDPALPAAKGLRVAAAGAQDIAAGKPGAGGKDGSNADAISQIRFAADSPDKLWGGFVTALAVTARTDLQREDLAGAAAASAVSMQLSQSSVDLDEESVSLLTYQHAYQASSRVITAIDEMLDVLINRTGLVGR